MTFTLKPQDMAESYQEAIAQQRANEQEQAETLLKELDEILRRVLSYGNTYYNHDVGRLLTQSRRRIYKRVCLALRKQGFRARLAFGDDGHYLKISAPRRKLGSSILPTGIFRRLRQLMVGLLLVGAGVLAGRYAELSGIWNQLFDR
jgi:hypothetical protein